MLKPGGVLGVEEHRASEGTPSAAEKKEAAGADSAPLRGENVREGDHWMV